MGPQHPTIRNRQNTLAKTKQRIKGFGGAWVAQSLSVCLRLRAWSQHSGIESHIGLRGWEPASSSPALPACVPSLAGFLYLCQINKILKKRISSIIIMSVLAKWMEALCTHTHTQKNCHYRDKRERKQQCHGIQLIMSQQQGPCTSCPPHLQDNPR